MANTILFSSRDHNAHLLATIVHRAGLRGCGGWPGRDKDNPLEAAGRALPSADTLQAIVGLARRARDPRMHTAHSPPICIMGIRLVK